MVLPSQTQHVDEDALSHLQSQANRLNGLPYAGDVAPQDAFAFLAAQKAVLVDVRTPEEWNDGVPDMAQTPSGMLTISWKTSPDYALNPNFASQLDAQRIDKDTPIFFMCRGGGRSLDAAVAMTGAGYNHCFNISGGFEGRPNVAGWKAAQLPWKKA